MYIHDWRSSRCLIPRRGIMLVGGEREADFAHGDPFQSAILIALYSFPSFLPPRSLRARDRQIFLSADQFGIILSSFRVLSSISSRAPFFNDKDRSVSFRV